MAPGEPYEPPALYHYLSLANRSEAEDRLAWAKDIVVTSTVFLRAPRDFNDPFDCRVVLSNDGSEGEWRDYLEPGIRRHFIGKPDAMIQERLSEAAAKARRSEVFGKVVADMQADVDGLGIFCLAESPLIPLMWSHYADNHRGLCLEFRHLNEPFFGRAQRVKYLGTRPRVDAIRSDAWEVVDALILTKPNDWAYEREWRIVDTEVGACRKSQFDASLLSGIILGAKVSRDHRETVDMWARERARPVQLMQARLNQETFSISLYEVDGA